MSLTANVLPSLSVRSPFVPRLLAPSCRVRLVQRSHGQIKAHKDARGPQQSLQQTGVQLTGAAGLLVPLMMSNSAMAATPDGEHLLKVCTCNRAVYDDVRLYMSDHDLTKPRNYRALWSA
jgi:hypothetical protein